jgi:hypothetical protein
MNCCKELICIRKFSKFHCTMQGQLSECCRKGHSTPDVLALLLYNWLRHARSAYFCGRSSADRIEALQKHCFVQCHVVQSQRLEWSRESICANKVKSSAVTCNTQHHKLQNTIRHMGCTCLCCVLCRSVLLAGCVCLRVSCLLSCHCLSPPRLLVTHMIGPCNSTYKP